MENPIRLLGEIIEAYDSGNYGELSRKNELFGRSLNHHYPLSSGDKTRFKLDNIVQTFALSSANFGVTEEDRENARDEYHSLKNRL